MFSKKGKRSKRPGRGILVTKMDREREIRRKWREVGVGLDERAARLWAATEARGVGRGGVSVVSRATGMSRARIDRGIAELEAGDTEAVRDDGRIRRPGGGRKRATSTQPGLAGALDALVEPTTRGDPMCALRWTCKSLRNLSEELGKQGLRASPNTVRKLLIEAKYSLQGTRKTLEGSDHPDRDAQFRYIERQVRAAQRRGEPTLSVDTKKKELVGPFTNKGREWMPTGTPEKVRVHDFPDEVLGKAVPYGVYDIASNEGWVSVGSSHDTPAFAVQSLRNWWYHLGCQRYAKATAITVAADGGGSNGHRPKAWKARLQELADEIGKAITVHHFPPGTSKWNKVEHKMFCYITQNWRGKPLTSLEVVVNLIGATKTRAGLKITAALDGRVYEKGVVVSDEEMASLSLKRHRFHGDWNYTIMPRIK